MPQQPNLFAENNFRNGLITEATALNFPQNAVTETWNCILDQDGSAYRRQGFDWETSFTTKAINRTNNAISTYLWQNVAGDGDLTVLVVQVGATIYFYEQQDTGSFSPGAVSATVTLTPVTGAPTPETVEAQYADGNGYLFVTHPYCDPMRVSYDPDASTVDVNTLTLLVRDFEGATADPYGVDERPTSSYAALNVHHKYNLLNQGWTVANLTAWDTAQTTMPSNADVMWRFEDASGNFDASNAAIARVMQGNSAATKGHYIMELADQDRDNVSGLTGLTTTSTAGNRPSTCAFFAGRMFYAGINASGFNSKVYFTQIVERNIQYEHCFQINDPTAEELFDILPSDGGVIDIQEAGTVHKLFPVPGGLCVFAANGVWFITGSTGIGFTAVDYAVQKIANISTLTHTSFVNVGGMPCWWNGEGIYVLQANSNSNLPTVQSMTDNKIRTFFQAIPLTSKRYARGYFNITEGTLQWIYRSEATNQITEQYEFDRILNFNTQTGAFYPWSVSSDSDVKINGLVSVEYITRPVTVEDVAENDLVDLIVDSSGNQVITFADSGTDLVQFNKFLVSYADGSSYRFTFAETNNDGYLDWEKYDSDGEDFDSYFITGYKLQGAGIRKFQNNYVRIFSRLETPVVYNFQGIWDFANTSNGTGRWSVNQYVEHDDTNYDTATRRLKVRGNGIALQMRVSSVTEEPFDILGWSGVQVTNQGP